MCDAASPGTPIVLHEGTGRTAVRLEARRIGTDIAVLLSGGTEHIGAIVLALPSALPPDEGINDGAPRPCIRTITVPGHRDDVPARALAMRLCLATNRPVCVTAGIHIDAASRKEIAAILCNAERACDRLILCLAQPCGECPCHETTLHESQKAAEP